MIRLAATADLGAIDTIVADAYAPYIQRIGKPPAPMLDDYRHRIAKGQAWVMDIDGAIAGLVVLEDTADGLLLDNVAVTPALHGSGIGRQLNAFAGSEAVRRGHATIRLYTHVLMAENVARYQRLGFTETARITQHGYDRVIMARPAG